MSSTLSRERAMEAIKILSGIGNPLFGRMLMVDLGNVQFQLHDLLRREDCAVCGNHS